MPTVHRILILVVLGLAACARVLPPDGGEKDTTPPVLQEGLSTPDRQTGFRPVEVRLVFDEWVQLKDALKEVLISPPIRKPPALSSLGKTILVAFDPEEPWKDSTTYTLYFGKAIVDQHEGNPASELRFVFSTGPTIDSLSASGTLLDARTRQPVPDALVLLHRDLRDSAVTLALPDHFARTDKNGRYRLDNLREGNFRVSALKERTTNYLYDLPDESFGTLEGAVRIDSPLIVLPNLFLSPPPKTFRILAVDSLNIPGTLLLAFSRPPDRVEVLDPEVGPPVQQWLSDTLVRLWADRPVTGLLSLDGTDTVGFSLYPATAAPLPVVTLPSPGAQLPAPDLLFRAPVPLISVDTSAVRIRKDTLWLPSPPAELSVLGDSLRLTGAGGDGSQWMVEFRPGALTAISGIRNRDTLRIPVAFARSADFARLRLSIDSLPARLPVICELVKGNATIGRWIHTGPGPWRLDLPPVLPGDYLVYLTLDSNRNGRWDGGDHYRRQRPEPRAVFPVNGLRANWETEVPLNPSWTGGQAN